jgi:hypothetical protein
MKHLLLCDSALVYGFAVELFNIDASIFDRSSGQGRDGIAVETSREKPPYSLDLKNIG